MRRFYPLLLILLFNQVLLSQTDISDTVYSDILKEKRYLSIHLPRSYDSSVNKKYPLIIALDSENIYYFTVANTEIYYDPDPDFQIIPETIVVGIKQNYNYKSTDNLIRGKDAGYDKKSGLLTKNAEEFKNFIYRELLPFIRSNYRINDFSAIIGHSLTATFVSNLLLENNNQIKAFISISPNLPDELAQKINLNNFSSLKIYYNSTGTYDLSDHKDSVEKFHNSYHTKERVMYKFDFFENENHLGLISRSLPNAIKHIFCLYKPTSEEAVKNLIQSSDKHLFLKNFAANSKYIYGEEVILTNSDFLEFYYYLENNIKDYWSLYKEIADIHLEMLPGTEAYFALGKYEEEYKKDFTKALNYYQKGYNMLEKDVSNKDSFLKDIQRIKLKIRSAK